VFAQRERLFIGKLTDKSRMPSRIDRMEGIKSSHSPRPPEIGWSYQIGLVQISHLFCLHIRIRLGMTIPVSLLFLGLAIARENIRNRRYRRDIPNLSLFQFPLKDLGSNAREGRTASFVTLQPIPEGQDLLNQTIRGLPPDLLGRTALILKTLNPAFFTSSEPFRKPTSTSWEQLQDLIKAIAFFVQSYCFPSFLIFLLIFHRLFLLPKKFGKKYRRSKNEFTMLLDF
jgi:hypothetical protein